MEISRKVIMSPSSSKISATFEVQKPSYGSRATRKGPRSDADLIYTTAIAASSGGRSSGSSETSSTGSSSGKEQQHDVGNDGHDDDDVADADASPPREYNEVIYLLPYYPSRIRFWVDERGVDDPRVAREHIREGRKGDAANCSVIEIRFISAEDTVPRPSDSNVVDAADQRWTCDIYIPPSRLINKLWVYRDPTKNTPNSPYQHQQSYPQKQRQHTGAAPAVSAPHRSNTQPSKPRTRALPEHPTRARSLHEQQLQQLQQWQQPVLPPAPLVPARASSLKYPQKQHQQRALPIPPAASAPALALPPQHQRLEPWSSSSLPVVHPHSSHSPYSHRYSRSHESHPYSVHQGSHLPSALQQQHHQHQQQQKAESRRVRLVVPEPEGFKNNYLADISRLSSRNGAFCLLSEASNEERNGDKVSRGNYYDDDDDEDGYRSTFSDEDTLSNDSCSDGVGVGVGGGVGGAEPPRRKLSFKSFVGRRARKSVFHEGAHGSGGAYAGTRIDVAGVDASRAEREREEAERVLGPSGGKPPGVVTKLVEKAIRRLARDDVH